MTAGQAGAYVLAAAALPPSPDVVPPPGVDAKAYREALHDDVLDLLDDLAGLTAYRYDTHDAAAVLDRLAGTGATIGAVVAGDAPDLPGLLVGKLLGACEERPAGVLPASDGRLVGLATRLPRPTWLDGLTLDWTLDRLHAVAPERSVVVGPGWHRLREPGDAARLDPRLEGWPATRALLSGYSA